MSFPIVVWILTGLAAVAIVLTRLRLRGEDAAGRFSISRRVPLVHFGAGIVALVFWLCVLVAPEDHVLGGPLVGILAIGAWWLTALCGLLILMRWLPAKGRHVPEASGDSWSDGPGLSLLAHLGMVVGVLVFTYAYLTAAV
jgi:hypothetical protein